MSAGPISLESSIRTCKVDVAYANKVESDRFLNPENMVCPVWNGRDNTGRRVCPDSFVTKRAGCNSATDRVIVENNNRPQYLEYVTLNAEGIGGGIYGDSDSRSTAFHNIKQQTGNYGMTGMNGAVYKPSCNYYPYDSKNGTGNKRLLNRNSLHTSKTTGATTVENYRTCGGN